MRGLYALYGVFSHFHGKSSIRRCVWRLRPSFRRFVPLKIQIPGALKGQLPWVSFRQHAVFRAGNQKLYPVAALYLERDIVACEGVHTVFILLQTSSYHLWIMLLYMEKLNRLQFWRFLLDQVHNNIVPFCMIQYHHRVMLRYLCLVLSLEITLDW